VWDLNGYTETAEHKLLVEAVDSLGLNRTSTEVPVTVTVIQPPHGLTAFFSRYRDSIIIGAVAFAALVLLLILFTGRLRNLFSRARRQRATQADPLTQDISAARDAPTVARDKTTQRSAAAASKTGRRKAIPAAQANAFLRRLQPDPLAAPGETFKPADVPPIALASREITFGADPKQSSEVLDDPSLEGRHALITRNDNGDFFVVDAGTIGGTWVNFEPVGAEARLLRHGDVLHFGQLVFRFELREHPEPEPPKVRKTPPA
jgi:hypothetical protein